MTQCATRMKTLTRMGFHDCVPLKILVLFVFYVGDCVSDEVIETVISPLR